jgi:hypothetical protein
MSLHFDYAVIRDGVDAAVATAAAAAAAAAVAVAAAAAAAAAAAVAAAAAAEAAAAEACIAAGIAIITRNLVAAVIVAISIARWRVADEAHGEAHYWAACMRCDALAALHVAKRDARFRGEKQQRHEVALIGCLRIEAHVNHPRRW